MQRDKGKKGTQEVELRSNTLGIELDGPVLRLRMAKGSPMFLTAQLLDLNVEEVRLLAVRKTGVAFVRTL